MTNRNWEFPEEVASRTHATAKQHPDYFKVIDMPHWGQDEWLRYWTEYERLERGAP